MKLIFYTDRNETRIAIRHPLPNPTFEVVFLGLHEALVAMVT